MEYLCDSNAYGKNTDRMKYRLADAMKQCMKQHREKIHQKEWGRVDLTENLPLNLRTYN